MFQMSIYLFMLISMGLMAMLAFSFVGIGLSLKNGKKFGVYIGSTLLIFSFVTFFFVQMKFFIKNQPVHDEYAVNYGDDYKITQIMKNTSKGEEVVLGAKQGISPVSETDSIEKTLHVQTKSKDGQDIDLYFVMKAYTINQDTPQAVEAVYNGVNPKEAIKNKEELDTAVDQNREGIVAMVSDRLEANDFSMVSTNDGLTTILNQVQNEFNERHRYTIELIL